MKIPEGWPTDVMIEVGANVISAAGRCDTWEEASAAAKHIYKAMSEHAPTPPAQEAEPVYQVLRKAGWDWDTVSKEVYELPILLADKRILYTHPDNDELRKAAEELCGANDIGAFGTALVKLRAALEKK